MKPASDTTLTRSGRKFLAFDLTDVPFSTHTLTIEWAIARLRLSGQTAQEIADAIANTVAAFRDHPAIAVWYLLDEPEGWWEQGGRKEEESLATAHYGIVWVRLPPLGAGVFALR